MGYKLAIMMMLICFALTLRSSKGHKDDNQGCDYAFGEHTYPNPSFYYQKDQNGTYQIKGRISINQVRNDSKFRAFFKNYLHRNVDSFWNNVTKAWNCTAVTNQQEFDKNYTPTQDFPADQFNNAFNHTGFACTVPQNSALIMWRTKMAPFKNIEVKLGQWGSLIQAQNKISSKQYTQLLYRLSKELKHQVNKYELTSLQIKAEFSQESSELVQSYLQQALQYNVAPKDMNYLPKRIQFVQKQFVRMLPPGTKFFAAKYAGEYANYVVAIHTSYQAKKQCHFESTK